MKYISKEECIRKEKCKKERKLSKSTNTSYIAQKSANEWGRITTLAPPWSN